MTIQMIDSHSFDKWRNQIKALLESSVKLNFPDYQIGDGYGKNKCDELDRYLKEKKAIVFVAVDDDYLTGWVWCHVINRLNNKRIHIAEIAVKENYQRSGVGSDLLSQVEKYAEDNGYNEIDLLVTKSNMSAVCFYEDSGYEIERYLMKKVI